MRNKFMKKASAIAIAAFFMVIAFSQLAWSATELTVYTAVEAEDLKKYAATFNEDHPDIKIKWVRDSTGIVTAKLLAEKNNPQADIIWGLAGTSLLLMKSEGMFEPYKPKGGIFITHCFRRISIDVCSSHLHPNWRRVPDTPQGFSQYLH